LSQIYVIGGDYVQAQEFLEKSLSLSTSGQDLGTLARVLYGLGDLHWRQGDPQTAYETLVKCLTMARQVGDSTQELNALNRLGTVSYDLGNSDNAFRYLEETLQRAQEVGNRERQASALNNLGEFTKPNDLSRALDYYQRALAISRELERQHGLALLLANLAEGNARLGNLTEARPLLYDGLALARRVGVAPLILIQIQAAGMYFYQREERARGLALIGLSIYHPATLADLQRSANQLLAFLGLSREDIEVTAALEEGRKLVLETEVEVLLGLVAG
jgi:tetratricopeptide (TPR) repeat protein